MSRRATEPIVRHWSVPYDRIMDARSVAMFLERPRPTVIKHCVPVACDMLTRRPLYSARDANTALEAVAPRRKAAHDEVAELLESSCKLAVTT